MKILAAVFAALALCMTSAVATASADDDDNNFYCDFLETYNPVMFAAYPPCN